MLSNSLLIAPCYIIIAGATGEGAVLTRERENTFNERNLLEPLVQVRFQPYGASTHKSKTNRDPWSDREDDNIIWSIQRIQVVSDW